MSARYGVIASLREENAAQQSVEHLMRDGEPIWDAIEFDVLCSRCDYNLRMLPKPRCPECGLEFDWNIVLNESAWKSDFLFEHHWHTRPIHSWLKTMRHSLRPIKFWKSISIHDRIHPGPLWFLLLTSVFWWAVTFHGLVWLTAIVIEGILTHVWQQTPSSNSPWLSLSHTLKSIAESVFDGGSLPLFAMLTLSILGALGLICLLRQTLGRCRVRTVQILRVVAYSSTPFFVVWAAVLLTCLTVAIGATHRGGMNWMLWFLQILALAVFVVLQGIYTGAGLKHYLHLPRSYFIGITAAFVGGLFGVTVVFFCTITAQMGW